jgi:hypothetical protein
MESDFERIIERKLILHDNETGRKGEILLAIGRPYWTEPGFEAACPVAIFGYFGRLVDIRGIDPMSAVKLAIEFLESMLRDLPKAQTLYWPSGDAYFED